MWNTNALKAMSSYKQIYDTFKHAVTEQLNILSNILHSYHVKLAAKLTR